MSARHCYAVALNLPIDSSNNANAIASASFCSVLFPFRRFLPRAVKNNISTSLMHLGQAATNSNKPVAFNESLLYKLLH